VAAHPTAEQAWRTIERQTEQLVRLAEHLANVAGLPPAAVRLAVDGLALGGSAFPALSDGRDGALAPRRVLVVDDNRDAADSVATLLTLWGHDARVAYDGPGAIAAALAAPPELCLLDLGMPGMSGYEVAERLRREPTLGRALLVAVTGFEQEADRARAQRAGFDGHLVKPVELAALQTLLARDVREFDLA
jgi:two-component system CheB/CheR fusion protein